MKLTRGALAILLSGALAVVPVACDDDGQPMVMGPTIDDLVGSYLASSVLLTLNADPAVTLNLVTQAGATVTLVVTNGTGGRFTFTTEVPGLPPRPLQEASKSAVTM